MARTPGQRAGLERDAVLAAAREVLADRGAAGLAMRSVATHLGVAPNALHSHVDNRTVLLDDLLDDLLAAVPVPGPDTDPVTGLRTTMLATFDLVGHHPDLVPLYLARQGARGPHARALNAATTTLLARAGVHEARAEHVVRALIVHTLGYAALVSAKGPVEADELRRDLDTGLCWLLAGALA